MLLLLQALGDVCSSCCRERVKLKGTGDGEAFQDEAARQTQSSHNLYFISCVFCCCCFCFYLVFSERESAGACVCVVPSRTGTAATTQQQRANMTRLAGSGQSGGLMGT